MKKKQILKIRSKRPLQELCAALPEAVATHGYGVMAIHDLKATMAKKGVDFERECRVFEVCNPRQAANVLQANMDVSAVLPCRISVYEEDGGTVLSAIRPTAMLGMVDGDRDGDGDGDAAEEVEVAMAAIMAQAARS